MVCVTEVQLHLLEGPVYLYIYIHVSLNKCFCFSSQKQIWFNNNCIETSTQTEGIENIAVVIDAWKNSLGANCRYGPPPRQIIKNFACKCMQCVLPFYWNLHDILIL